MAFLNKEQAYKLAEEYGIDYEKLSWTELQKAIAAAQKRPTEMEEAPKPKKKPKLMDQYYGKSVMIAPELAPQRYRLLKYDEELGNEYEVAERKFDMNMSTGEVFDVSGGEINYDRQANISVANDYTTGTYRIKGKTGRKVIAMSSTPKENYGCGIRVGIDYVPIVTWQGRTGYLWTHQSYPNVKNLLQQSGYYHKYKDLFKEEPNIWYVAGKTLACDKSLVDYIFAEIEQEEREKFKERQAYRQSIGAE